MILDEGESICSKPIIVSRSLGKLSYLPREYPCSISRLICSSLSLDAAGCLLVAGVSRDCPWITVMFVLSAIGTAIAIGTAMVSQAIGGDIVLCFWIFMFSGMNEGLACQVYGQPQF